MTGFFRDGEYDHEEPRKAIRVLTPQYPLLLPRCLNNPGYCNTSAQDGGSHTLAAQVTPQFLEFSANRGNDLRSILSPGCKWCLCVSRWKEALTAYRSGEVEKSAVPR